MKIFSPVPQFLRSPILILFLLGLGSAAALAAALIAQYVFHFAPCHLCILQRWPHVAVVVIALAGVVLSPRRRPGPMPIPIVTPLTGMDTGLRRYDRLLIVCCLLLMIGFGIAAYHTAVEQRWVQGPGGCTSLSKGNESIEELRREIANAPLVSCDQPVGSLFGVSLVIWSGLIYAFLIILALYGIYCSRSLKEVTHARRSQKNPPPAR